MRKKLGFDDAIGGESKTEVCILLTHGITSLTYAQSTPSQNSADSGRDLGPSALDVPDVKVPEAIVGVKVCPW